MMVQLVKLLSWEPKNLSSDSQHPHFLRRIESQARQQTHHPSAGETRDRAIPRVSLAESQAPSSG